MPGKNFSSSESAPMNKIAVVAIGGNSISPEGERGDIPEQFQNVHETCRHFLALFQQGYEIVLTHGNGPQVGNALRRVELASKEVYPLPLDICVADTEGGMGYMIQQILGNELANAGIRKPVVTLITQTVVNADDPAFKNPTKPIGPFYSKELANEYKITRGWNLAEDAGRGFRRVVPSPTPQEIVECPLIKTLLKEGAVVIAAGGGGVPVIRTSVGMRGVEAVVDKDLASSLLASQIGAELFLISTGVESVSLYYKTPKQQSLKSLSLSLAKKYLGEGHFPPGSMGPKIKAAIAFLENRASGNKFVQGILFDGYELSKEVIITSPHVIKQALTGMCGTHIYID